MVKEIIRRELWKRFPNHPELEWGDQSDPQSNYPKCQMERILHAYGEESNQSTFCLLAQNMDIAALRTKCPISFEDFYGQLVSLKKDS